MDCCCNGCMTEMHMEVRISRVQMQVLVLRNALNIVSDALEVGMCNWRHCVCHGESIGQMQELFYGKFTAQQLGVKEYKVTVE